MKKTSLRTPFDVFMDAFIVRNIVLVQAIGLCPVIMAGTHLKQAVVLTVCTAIILVPSSLIMSLFGEKIPAWLLPPIYTIFAAALLTASGFAIERYVSPELYAALDIFIPLLAVNTLLTFRAGGFALRNRPAVAVADSIASTFGFGLVICVVSVLREIASFGTVWDIKVTTPRLLPEAALPYAAFILLGFMAAFIQWIKSGIAAVLRKRQESVAEGIN